MYITANMANLQKCSRCKSEIDVSYFGLNRKKQPYKTCVNCRSKVKRPCTQLKRSDTDFVDDTISTTTPEITEEEEEQLPMNEHDAFWLFESSNKNGIEAIDNGKWMLFYPNDKMNEMWKFAKKFYKANQLTGVRSMKCSTAKENPRASSSDNGIIILYSSYSEDEKYIKKIGQNILATFKYQEFPYMYYKSDEQTFKGTRATGSEKNHMYKLKTTTDACIHTDITRTPHTVYDWMEGTLEKERIKKLLVCRADEEDIEFIASLNLKQLETMCLLYFELDGWADNVDGTPNAYCLKLALKYILNYDISPKRILRLYNKLTNGGMSYLAVYNNLDYIKAFVLNFNGDRRASLVEYGRFCEDVLGIPPEPIEQPTDQKYIIVMDCETNGLIKQRGLNPTQTNLNMFPRVVQFSWGLYTEDGECKEVKDFIIKPTGWTINGSDRYHGITQERATTEGVDIKDVLAKV